MTKEEIKASYTMRDILARYGIQPNRSGYIPCPFHQEKTGSMKIYERDFHCFGCGENGDIFTFVQRMESVTFMEAFRLLGGTSEPEERKIVAARMARIHQEGLRKAREEFSFKQWRLKRMEEVCRLLRMLDELLPTYKPLSDLWCSAMEMKIKNEYRYYIMTSGTRAEQEEMR